MTELAEFPGVCETETRRRPPRDRLHEVYRCARCRRIWGVNFPPDEPCPDCGSEEFEVGEE